MTLGDDRAVQATYVAGETDVGRAVVEAVEIDRLVDELSLRRLNHRRPIGILRAG
jgi:hypothetical protein